MKKEHQDLMFGLIAAFIVMGTIIAIFANVLSVTGP